MAASWQRCIPSYSYFSRLPAAARSASSASSERRNDTVRYRFVSRCAKLLARRFLSALRMQSENWSVSNDEEITVEVAPDVGRLPRHDARRRRGVEPLVPRRNDADCG